MDLHCDGSGILVGLNEGLFSALRWCASSSIFATNCKVGRGTNSCWKSAGRGARESIPDPVPRGPRYVVCHDVSGHLFDMLFILINHVVQLEYIVYWKNPNNIKIFLDILIVSTEYGRLFRAGLFTLLRIS